MANNSSTFTLGIKTKVDSAELNRLKQQLREIQLMASDVDFTTGMNPTQIQHMTTAARQLDAALTAAFDVELNTLNIQKFNDYLKRTGTDLQQIQKGLYNAGAIGQASFAKATAELFKFNTAAKQTNVFIDKMADSMANTVRWGVTSSIFNNIVGSVQKAYYYIEDLDTSINDIQIVTEKSADEMARFAEQANNAAKSLATTTTDYTEGALIYYQQGLDDETVKTLTDITAKTSNVTGQGMQAVSEQLTAVWNGYQVANEAAAEGMQVYEEYVDKMAAVGAATASDLEELAIAMSKVASAANAMGVDFDQLSAQIATIVSVTRQAPESVGTALKTIYARIGDLKMDGVDEFGVSLGEVSGQLEQVGIQIMDQSGNMRDVGVVMEEVASKWGTWNEAQQQSIAIAIAGKRQYNNLLALFENWDMYTDTLETAANAAGTLDKQQSIALESLENKLEKLTATAEDLYDSLFDEESLKDLVDGVTPLVQGLADMADAIGGLNNLLPMLGSIGMQVFSKHLANGLATFRHNLLLSTSETYKQNQAIQDLSEKYKTLNFADSSGKVDAAQKAVLQDMVNFAEEMLTKRKYMTEEEEEYYNKILDEKAVLAEQVALLKVAKEHRDNETGFGLSKAFGDNLDVKKVEQYNSALVFLEKQLNDLRSGKKGVIGLENIEKAKTDLYGFVQVLKNMGASQESIDIVEKKIKSLGRTVNGTKKISDQSLNKIIAYFKDFSFAAIDVAKLEEAVEELGLNIQKTENNFKNTLNFKDFINTASNAIGAIGQLVSSINTLSNLKDIFSNEDLTEGEKFTQIIMNLSYAIPSLLFSLHSLGTVLGFSTLATVKQTQANKEAIATKLLSTGMTMAQVRADQSFIAAETAATAAVAAFNKTLLASPLLPFIAIIGGFVAAWGAVVAIYDAVTVSAEEASEKLVESIQKYKEVENELSNLNNELDNTNTKLKELYSIADEDLTIANKQEIATLEAQNAALAAQIELKKQQLDLEQKETVKTGNEAIESGSFDIENNTLSENLGAGEFNVLYQWSNLNDYLDKNGQPNINLSDTNAYNKFVSDMNIAIAKAEANDSEYATIGDAEIHVDVIKDMLDTWTQEREDYNIEIADKYQQAIEALPAYYAQNTEGQYNTQIAQLESIVKEYYTSSGQLGTISESMIQGVFSSNEDMNNVIDNVLGLDEVDDESIKDAFISAMGVAEGESAFDNLQIKARTLGISMYDLITAADEYGVTIKSIADGSNLYTVSYEQVNKLSSALDKLREGNELTAEELTSLLAKYPELTNIWDETSRGFVEALEIIREQEEDYNQGLLKENVQLAWENAKKALDKYNASLEETNEVSNDMVTGGLKQLPLLDSYYKELANGEGSKELAELNEALEEMFNAKYELEISLTNDILTDIDNIVTAAEGVAKAVELIGDGFQLAAEDSEELFRIFPELAHEAEVLADGTIQLNQSVVEQTLSNNGIIIDSDKKVTAENIDNRIAILETEKAAAEAKLKEIRNTAAGELDINALLEEDYENFVNYEANLNQTQTNDAIENSGLSAEAEIKNWIAQEEAAKKYAKIKKEALAGEVSDISIGDVSSYGITYQEDTSNDTANIDPFESMTPEELKAALEGYYQNQIDSYSEQIADLIVGKSKIYDSVDGIRESAKEDKGDSISPKDLKEYMDEFDRYWEINKAIEAVTENLDDLSKVQDHLFGKELITSLEKENKLLDQQAEKYKTLFGLQKQEASELQNTLSNFGVAFDVEGGIANYASVTQSMLNQYNAMVAQHNSGAISEETFDTWEKDYYEKFQKALERYEELFYGEMVDVQNQLDDIYYEQLANNLEAWEVEIELNLELNEAEREWSDFLKEINDDFKATYRDIGKDFANIFENMNSYSKDGGTIAIDTEALRKAEAELAKLQEGVSSDMFASVSEAEEKVKELKETLMEDVESVHGLWVDAWDAYMEGIDQAASKFDDLMGKFENIDEELEYQGELIELLYGSQAYDLMDSLYDAQIFNSLAQVDSLKQQANMWKELYDNAEEGSEEQTKYYEEWQEAQSNLNDAVVEHINLLKKDYSNALDKIIDNLEKELTGGLGLSEMRENWEEATAAAEKYYDATERIYELETLESKFENAINGTSSLENQQKLKKLMDDQLADLEAKEKLTEYDITLAEKRLAIAQAEMALEDAQNAKNSMKLVRGANGNWEYQYVADEEDIAAKQQEMLDAYHNLYEYVKEAQQESVESILNMTEQFFTKMNEIRNDDSLSEEEKMIKMEELRDKYYGEEGKITVLQQEFADRTDDMNMANAEFLWGLYQADEDNYRDMTEAQQGLLDDFIENGISDYASLHSHVSGTYISMQDDLEKALDENMIPTWSSAAQTMADAWNADDGASIKAQVSNALDAIDEKTKEYESKLDELSEKSGKSFGEEGLAKDINKAVEATEKLNEVTEELCNDTITLLEDYRDAVKNIEQAWLDAYDAAMKALTTGDSKDEENPPAPTPTEPTPPPVTPSVPSESEDDSSKGKYISEAAHWDSSGKYDSKHPPQPTNMTMYLVDTNPGSKYPYGVAKRPGWSRYGWVSAFDTGGYTGEWSTGDGKLAMLHQKELVLNADDTENVLEVVRLTRDMASLTSSVGSAVMDGVKMMLYDLMGMKAPGNNMVMTPQVADGDNIFNITAEFPNANDVTSIREAILSLPNMASQYLSQNKK